MQTKAHDERRLRHTCRLTDNLSTDNLLTDIERRGAPRGVQRRDAEFINGPLALLENMFMIPKKIRPGTQNTDDGMSGTASTARGNQVTAASLSQVHVRRRMALAWLAVALLITLTATLAGCSGDDGDAQGATAASANERVVRVETLILEPTNFEDVIEVTGTVDALDDATLSAQSSGTVLSLAPLGTNLESGATVAQLDPTMAQSAMAQAEGQVEAAQASFDLAEDNLRRQEPLYRDSVISALEWENVRAQYNQARASLSQAEAGLASAQEQLRQTRVSTPFGGRVEEHFVELGEQVTPGREIARVINTNRVKVVAGVPERYSADIRVGTPVLLEFRAYSGPPIRGNVSFVGGAINPSNRTFPVEVVVDNRENILKPEMVANVNVTRRQIEDALVVPRDAILRTEEGNIVYVVSEEGDRRVAERRDVVTGPTFGGRVVVTNLQPDDEVIVLGQANLTEGDALQVMERYDSPEAIEVADSTTID